MVPEPLGAVSVDCHFNGPPAVIVEVAFYHEDRIARRNAKVFADLFVGQGGSGPLIHRGELEVVEFAQKMNEWPRSKRSP
jgi:hypothetical protein